MDDIPMGISRDTMGIYGDIPIWDVPIWDISMDDIPMMATGRGRS